MTALVKFTFNNINGLAKVPILLHYGVLSRSSLRGAAVDDNAARDSACSKLFRDWKPGRDFPVVRAAANNPRYIGGIGQAVR